MEDIAFKLYIEELERQCNHTLQAHNAVINSYSKLIEQARSQKESWKIERDETFRNLHSFLTHSSCVSRLLFPPGSGKNSNAGKRAAYLKNYLGVQEDHGIASRTLRDHLEHYEERLDK